MTERQRDALVAACQAHGATLAAISAYTEADRLVNAAMRRAENVAGVGPYVRDMHRRIVSALEKGWAALREVQDEIGDLIVELKRGQQPPEPTDFSI